MDIHKTCCFTGHRSIPQSETKMIERELDDTIAILIKQGIQFFCTGMAIGFDTIAAQAVLRAKKKSNTIKLIAVLPCANQDERWSPIHQELYRVLLKAADTIICVSEEPYHVGCMANRNQYLITHSSICVAYMKHERSGTAQTVRMARKLGVRIINLANQLPSVKPVDKLSGKLLP